ncbi:hypothetical protein ABK040_005697 [Willaertia magna]
MPWLLLVGFLLILLSIIIYFVLEHFAKKQVTIWRLMDFKFVDEKELNNLGKNLKEKQVNVNNSLFKKRHENQAEQYSILNDSDLDLSIVFPAYKEESRIYNSLKETFTYLENKIKQNPNFKCELLIVDDGSTDNTVGVVIDFMKEYLNKNTNIDIQLLRLIKNKGKGFAVKQGMIRSRGKLILFADSDNATDINDLDKLLKEYEEMKVKLSSKYGYMLVGSRDHLVEGVKRERKWYRNITMYTFHYMVYYIANIKNIKDTQCGFKLLDRDAVRHVLPNMKIDRWCFDIDLIHIANTLNIPIAEIPVNWTEIEGSKVNIFGIIGMAIDLVLIRLYYTIGFWRVIPNPKIEPQVI